MVPRGTVIGALSEPPLSLLPVVGERSVVLEHGPLEPATGYTLRVLLEGEERETVVRVEAPARREAVGWGPERSRVGARDEVWARFGAEVDRASVEESFRLEPAAEGSLDWPSPRTVRFRPRQRLAWGTAYKATVAGRSSDGEHLAERSWSFRTLVPPPAKIRPGEGKPVVLTFDDGARTRGEVIDLLGILERHRVRAIFFPSGWWARAHPDLVERIRREGHLLCNHSSTHPNLSTLGEAEIEEEIAGGAGRGECDLLRPPMMGTSPRVERVAARMGYRVYLWDVDSRDWEGLPAEDIENLVLSRVKPSAVVLFHMHAAHTREALPSLLERLRAAGYALTFEGAEGVPIPQAPPEAGPGEADAGAPLP